MGFSIVPEKLLYDTCARDVRLDAFDLFQLAEKVFEPSIVAVRVREVKVEASVFAIKNGVCFVQLLGVKPGIDHLADGVACGSTILHPRLVHHHQQRRQASGRVCAFDAQFLQH